MRHVPETERRPVGLERRERDSGPGRGPGLVRLNPASHGGQVGSRGCKEAAGSLPQTAAPTRRSWERGWRRPGEA